MRYLSIAVTILRQPRALLLTGVIAWLVFTGAVWLPNLPLIVTVLGSAASVGDKLTFLGTLYQSIGSNFTVVSATCTILIALLFGVQITLLRYYILATRTAPSALRGVGSAGVGGLVVGVFGIGCAACGTFILTTVLSLIGAAGLLSFLPLHGEEFGLLGVGLLSYSIWLLLKRIDAPKVCPI